MQPTTRTKRQKQVLDFITRYIDSHGYEPSYQLIARHLGVSSKGGIAKHIKALEEQGHFQRRRDNGKFKLDLGHENAPQATGILIEWLESDANDDREDWESEPFAVPEFMLNGHDPERIRAFRVQDDAMSGKSISYGDVVLIEERSHARDGDCIVVEIGGEETLLRIFSRHGANIELRAANDDFEARRMSAEDIEIRGIFRGLLRPKA